MSIDYVFYLSDESPESKIQPYDFVETSKRETIIQGSAFKGLLSVVIAHDLPEDSFIREELPFKPHSKVIATIDLDRYDESIEAVITLTAALIESCQNASLFLNNETVLLSKSSNETTLHVGETSFWNDHLDSIGFPYKLGSQQPGS